MALVPLLVISLMGAAFLQLSGVMARRQQEALDLKRVFYLCEAGLYEAMTGLYQGKTGNVGTEEQPAYFGGGYFWVRASEPAAGLVQLDSFARCQGARAQLAWVVQKIQFNFCAFGFFSSGKLAVKKGSFIDGYDSTLGSYASQVEAGLTQQAGRLASNGNIEIDGKVGKWTYVNGSAQPGLEGTVKTAQGVTLTGNKQSLDELMLPPEFVVPSFAEEKSVKQKSPVPMVLASGERQYRSIAVEARRELIIQGPATIVVNDLQIGKNAKLTLDTTDGPVKVHVLHSAKFERASALLTSSGSPRQASLLVGDGRRGHESADVTIGESARINALLFAPQDRVEIKEGAELFGSVVAGQLDLGESVRLHFDQALGLQENQYPRHVSWRIVDLAKGPLDPFASSGLDRSSLAVPADAHQDVWLEITYRTGKGLPKLQYKGWWNDFDWSAVYELAPHYKAFDAPGGDQLIHIHP